MSSIKRILWVDDVAQNRASSLFPVEETRIVTSMDAAIEEISGPHLYDYDTIVLDIDFENGLHNAPKVMEQLSSQIFLDDAQKNNQFIITNGGYLLYLYLLKRGYPSSQIAFLTGNTAIVEQLRAYAKQTERSLTKTDIELAFRRLWSNYSDDPDSFENEVEKLPVGIGYKQSDFLIDCEQALDAGDYDALSNLILSVPDEDKMEKVENTGDMMIFRFHQANLEAPAYFSKQDNDIAGHNKVDAERWMLSLRTTEQVVRWLFMSAGNVLEELYSQNSVVMQQKYNDVYKDAGGNMRSAFRQMYFTFDGLRSGIHKEVYFQAVSAMMVPYEAAPHKFFGQDKDILVRRHFAWCSKIARNLLAHNRFGTHISSKTSLLLLLFAVSTLLDANQRSVMNGWYKKCCAELTAMINGSVQSIADTNHKIRQLFESFIANNEIAFGPKKAEPYSTYETYNSIQLLYALPNNMAIDSSGLSDYEIENYFQFSLAAGFVKWFRENDVTRIEANYGPEVKMVLMLATAIIDEYQYPCT